MNQITVRRGKNEDYLLSSTRKQNYIDNVPDTERTERFFFQRKCPKSKWTG